MCNCVRSKECLFIIWHMNNLLPDGCIKQGIPHLYTFRNIDVPIVSKRWKVGAHRFSMNFFSLVRKICTTGTVFLFCKSSISITLLLFFPYWCVGVLYILWHRFISTQNVFFQFAGIIWLTVLMMSFNVETHTIIV